MAAQKSAYTASKVRSGRPGWTASFRHPLRRDNRGRLGLKVRRGLGTTNEAEADALVAQLQNLIDDKAWHHAERRKEAEKIFAPVVVSAFFHGVDVGSEKSEELREAKIPLPGRDEAYSRIMLVGTTGAGKTTLLRHIIGSDHIHDRFPSTSTARTTIADTEIVIAPGMYQAAVTFTPEHVVRGLIDECLEAACVAAIEGQTDDKIASALLTHHEQRFRLSYLLGEWNQRTQSPDTDFDFGPQRQDNGPPIGADESVPDQETSTNRNKIIDFVNRIRRLALLVKEGVSRELGPLTSESDTEDKTAWIELFGEVLLDQEEFSQISLDTKDAIETRFDLIKLGEIEREASGWPALWHYTTDKRELFLKQIRWFSSNHFRQFGRLLTPLVNGLRVKGPFEPSISTLAGENRFVIVDGQGLGHVAEVAPSISTGITQRFSDFDVILLVDSAQQPMQVAPVTLLKSVASSGHGEKIALAFTHFDQVTGDNLNSFDQKRAHVMASVHNALATLRQRVPVGLVDIMEKSIENNCFLLGGLDRSASELPPGVIRQFEALFETMQARSYEEQVVEAAPIYGISGLELAIRDAVEGFVRPWEARLGLGYRDGIRKEHWSRVKALSRRFAMGWSNEYDSLRPVADLVAQLQEEVSRWMDRPSGWTRKPKDAEEREAALDRIRRSVSQAFHELAERRLALEHRDDWRTAYSYRRKGSALKRAEKVRDIYEEGAPPISSAMPITAQQFLDEIIGIVTSAVTDAGGMLEWSRERRAKSA